MHWNDFDTLIAAEAEIESEFDAQFMEDFILLPMEDAAGVAEHHGKDIGDVLVQHEQASRLDGAIHPAGVETAMPC